MVKWFYICHAVMREDIKRFGHNFELYLINVDGTGLEKITYNNVFDSFPCFLLTGKNWSLHQTETRRNPGQLISLSLTGLSSKG